MKYLIFISLFFILTSLSENTNEFTFVNKEFKIVYHKTNGRIDGHYTSYYKNGQKQAEGDFDNNLRSGTWTLWDTTGKILVQRIYQDPFTFKQIIPTVANDKPIALLNIPRYKLEYNKDGFIDYSDLREWMVVWSKRIWRNIDEENNEALFENNILYSTLNKYIFNDSIKAYADEEFKYAVPTKDIDTANTKVIGFKIKEDSFFDKDRFVFETRIIGICPLVVKQATNDTTKLYWIYFPQIRKYLAKESVLGKNLPSKIKTLDDLFFFRCFSSRVYKESNIYDREKKKNMTQEEIDEFELNLIELEHGMWLYFLQ